jgi:hypothetical protein
MNTKNGIDLRSQLKISGMSLGVGVVHQFAPMTAQQAEADIANAFARNRDGGANSRREQQYLRLKAD